MDIALFLVYGILRKTAVDTAPEPGTVVASPVQDGENVDHAVSGVQVGLDATRKGNTRVFQNSGIFFRDILRHLLAGKPLTKWAYAAVDWSDKLDPATKTVRVRFALQKPDGKPLTGGFARLTNVGGNKAATVDKDGRGSISVSRAKVPKTQGQKFRRLEMELDWPGAPKPRKQALLIVP